MNYAIYEGERKKTIVSYIVFLLVVVELVYLSVVNAAGVFDIFPRTAVIIIALVVASKGHRWGCVVLSVLLLADAALGFYGLASYGRYSSEFKKVFSIVHGIVEVGCAALLYFDPEIREYCSKRRST